MPDLSLEQGLEGFVAGIDEAGRGPISGPCVAAAVIIPDAALLDGPLKGVNDSKKLSAGRRQALREQILEHCLVGVGQASPAEIDEINILQATFLAMRRAMAALPARPDFALIDGNRLPKDFAVPARAVVKGDSISASIAAASIIAKTTRDAIMAELDAEFPGYGWSKNAGYPTRSHYDAITLLGVTPHHRRSFAGVLA